MLNIYTYSPWYSVWHSIDSPSHYLPDAHAELIIPAAAAMTVGVERLDMLSDGGDDEGDSLSSEWFLSFSALFFFILCFAFPLFSSSCNLLDFGAN